MESNWFTWVTSLSHFPMTIKCDENGLKVKYCVPYIQRIGCRINFNLRKISLLDRSRIGFLVSCLFLWLFVYFQATWITKLSIICFRKCLATITHSSQGKCKPSWRNTTFLTGAVDFSRLPRTCLSHWMMQAIPTAKWKRRRKPSERGVQMLMPRNQPWARQTILRPSETKFWIRIRILFFLFILKLCECCFTVD